MAEEGFIFAPGEIVKRPYSLVPWSNPQWQKNAMWIHMKAKKITDQTTAGRGGSIAGGADGAEFVFLGPDSISENIGHTWDEYDSIQSRVANKVRDAAKLGAELKSLGGGLSKFNVGDISKVFTASMDNFGSAAETLVKGAYNAVASHSIPKIKVDTPLYYGGSERRQLTLEFSLAVESVEDDERSNPRRSNPKRDVLDVVQDLMRYSAASSKGDVDIEFPYYFEVWSEPGRAINYTTAALMAVQPTWTGPWLGGYPIACKVSLVFKDISPLYRQTITRGSIINIVNRDKSRSAEARQQTASNLSNAQAAEKQKREAEAAGKKDTSTN
jgi:hypothetical protein